VFAPLHAGSRSGALQVYDLTNYKLLNTVMIYGVGTGPQIAYPLGAPVTWANGSDAPAGVAVDGVGNLYIADAGNGRLVEVPAGSADVITLATASTLGVSPIALAVGGQGDIFVTGQHLSLFSNPNVVELPRSQPPALKAITMIARLPSDAPSAVASATYFYLKLP
jgi:hypothetical protein